MFISSFLMEVTLPETTRLFPSSTNLLRRRTFRQRKYVSLSGSSGYNRRKPVYRICLPYLPAQRKETRKSVPCLYKTSTETSKADNLQEYRPKPSHAPNRASLSSKRRHTPGPLITEKGKVITSSINESIA